MESNTNNNVVSKTIDKTKTKEMIESFVKFMGVKLDSVEIVEDSTTNRTVFVIKSTESGLLIGDNGDNFHALTLLIKRIVCKGDENLSSQFAIDVNDYQSSMIENIKTKAIMLANRVRDLKSNVEMDPMSSYERLIVHGALADQQGIKTESIGLGKERRVVIKYIS